MIKWRHIVNICFSILFYIKIAITATCKNNSFPSFFFLKVFPKKVFKVPKLKTKKFKAKSQTFYG